MGRCKIRLVAAVALGVNKLQPPAENGSLHQFETKKLIGLGTQAALVVDDSVSIYSDPFYTVCAENNGMVDVMVQYGMKWFAVSRSIDAKIQTKTFTGRVST